MTAGRATSPGRRWFHVKHGIDEPITPQGDGDIRPPPTAHTVFGERLAIVERYVDLLATAGIERGLVGPQETGRLWDRHVLNCAVVQSAVPRACALADVGSGAGLPGVVLAIMRPDLEVTLVEPMQRRARFLGEVVDELELANVAVARARAEDLVGELTADVVTARAVAPLERLAKWTLPLLPTGGRLLALKGGSVGDEVARAAGALRRLGAASWQIREYGSGIVDPPTRVVVVEVGPRVRNAVSGRRRRTKGRT